MIAERVISAASACTLLAAVGLFNDQVGQALHGVLNGRAGTEFSSLGNRLVSLHRETLGIVGSYAGDNLWLVGYGLCALVLLGLMLRT